MNKTIEKVKDTAVVVFAAIVAGAFVVAAFYSLAFLVALV